MGKKRPENVGTAANFYNNVEAEKYTQNTRIINVQTEMTERAIELMLNDAEDKSTQLILDVGCGSCISGRILTEHGYNWIGMDINVARKENVEAELLQSDMGDGVSFRGGVFDGCISVSALQWLCNAEHRTHDPIKRIRLFFNSLFAALKHGCRAVFQFYPQSSAQVEILTTQAMKAGFTGGVVVDFPNSAKAKKMYLVLNTPGFVASTNLEVGAEDKIVFQKRQANSSEQKHGKLKKKSREWILQKKEKHKQVGKSFKNDSKYTGRRRKSRF